MDKLTAKTVRGIKSLKIQGARNIAIAALDALEIVAKKSGFGKEFLEAANALQSSRKTAVPLYNAICAVKSGKSIESIKKTKQFLELAPKKSAEFGAKLIRDGSTIITHCHSSEAIMLLKLAKANGKKFKIIVTETRPKMQGISTAKELVAAGIPVEYIVDSAAGHYMKGCNIAIFGCDSIRKEGIYNKIGTYLMALCAYENKVPVYFAGDSMKIDWRPKIEIEMRSSEEIISQKVLSGAKILNPAFDCTPWKLISGVITEKGIAKSWGELSK